ncbi:threonine aldolase family protein [Chitinophaga nivalis]|uniref:Aminotransferase class I/II-fold pyridoxal phosphate-dependent enzyme n=1 Tax=Chitinophaga nivalis TaxID=2991709 RepID=A0ABT3IPX3_9BACT|nr:GntG family PLP-dependent aldolase [Chitinophaga nivalis]MCW3464305.1 aminotransferase class I/II-fold pyridoxal phosphate-dependent enzyme [Chitinophaga nivalis]MCW3486004.1 aminotransferase class I/II-fold pyridoxal phosphate-dependent enzyme [Chitinophaga nivalis]
MIDFRSDTFTRPGPGMLQAMLQAETGDDVFGEDPSVNQLEAMMAAYFGKAAALYCPSGTMSNQIAIKVHTVPGDEVICSHLAHVYIYEGGGIAFNAGAQVHPIIGSRGMITAAEVLAAINPDDVHKARTSLVCLENTANRGGGCCYDWEEMVKIKAVCQEHGLALHLDGARLFNALVATGQSPVAYGQLFDSISVCLNKGMGCPMGSVLLGSHEFIKAARRIRKKFGGGLRQAGFMAATGIYAMEHNLARLEADHQHAKQIAHALLEQSFTGHMLPVETNILIFEITGDWTPAAFAQHLKKADILVMPISATQVRMVTHLDITPEMVNKTCEVIAGMA